MNPRLIAISGPLSGGVFRLADGEFTMGRSELNSLTVPDRAVSRRHCVIRNEGGLFKLLDLESRNGCFVNNVPVHEHTLKHSDRITIGDSHFVFLLSDDRRGHPSSETVKMDDSQVISGQTVQLRPQDSVYLQPQHLLSAGTPSGREARDLGALLKICQALDSSHDLATLAKGLLDLLLDLVEADRGAILVREASGEIRAAYARWRDADHAGSVIVSRKLVRDVLGDKKALMCNDVLQDARIKATESIVAASVTALLIAPIMTREQSGGVIYLAASNPVRPFEEADLQLVAALAGVAAPAFESACQLERLQEENRRLHEEIAIEHPMVGNSPGMEQVYRFIGKAAPRDATVLITGESGTGKELVARALHINSPRASGPFVPVNSTALAENLVESELFGHEKGAFTTAVATKKGLLEAANGGTLFLDEIGDMPLTLQPKLLRAIEERQFTRVGGTEPLKVDIRIIAATHRDLEELIKSGSFRQDLYFRFNVLSVHVPPLRERREDIVPLARYFLSRERRRERRPMEFSPEAEACLKKYDWPGNVRELENAIERAMVVGQEPELREGDFIFKLPGGATGKKLEEMERAHILRVVEECGGNQSHAAEVLDIDRVTLYHKLKKYGWSRSGAKADGAKSDAAKSDSSTGDAAKADSYKTDEVTR
jgi:transcriptional regulator with GAF, ATPase, and Fis domain